MKMNRRLIVTADDYGLCDSVNQAIEACLDAGTICSTCVMTNMPDYHDAAQLRHRFPDMSVGIHWTMTQGMPVLSASKIPSLVNADGMFYSRPQFLRKWLANQVNISELKAEFLAQIQRLRKLVGLPDFWNTHQDIHMLPGMFKTCVSLGLEFGIPAMRSHRRIMVFRHTSPTRHYLRHPIFWLKGLVISQWSRHAETQGMRMPDGKVYLGDYDIRRVDIEKAIERLPWKSISRAAELVIHPAMEIDEALMPTLRDARLREYQVFSDRRLVDGLCERDIQIVSYGSLEHGR